jgi:hypothetical protein
VLCLGAVAAFSTEDPFVSVGAGKAAATISDVATLAANPREATRNIATTVEAIRTAVGAGQLMRGQWNNFKSAVSYVISHQPF